MESRRHLDKIVQELGSILDIGFGVSTQAEEGIKDIVEEGDEALPGHFGHIVQGLTGIVPHSGVLHGSHASKVPLLFPAHGSSNDGMPSAQALIVRSMMTNGITSIVNVAG